MKLAESLRGSSYTAILLTLLAATPLVFAQAPATTPRAHAKTLAFDVVSIRPAKPGTLFSVSSEIAPNGYHVNGLSLWSVLMLAYFPQGSSWYWTGDRLAGDPSWVSDDLYEIDARVSDADRAAWQKQSSGIAREPMLQEMLQTLLAERCHLVAHMVPGPPLRGVSLELGKHGAHFAESRADEVLPDGNRFPDGGIQRSYGPGQNPHFSLYGATMADVALALTNRAQRPVLDHTGLTGRYNLVLNWVDGPDSNGIAGKVSADDPFPLSHWGIEALGLRAIPISIPAQTLVIDHIEKPSDN